jgi:heptosyltransferase-2
MIRAPNWVGDAVMAVPALREIRRTFSNTHLTIVAKPWVAGLFEGEKLCDEQLLLPETPKSSVVRFFAAAGILKREQFDVAILFQNAIGAALLAKVARIPTIAGYPTDGRRYLLDFVVPLQRNHKKLHQVYYYLNIAAAIERELRGQGFATSDKAQPSLHLTGGQQTAARRLLADSGIGSHKAFAVINPGATNSRAKRWPAERFAQVADRLVENDGMQIAIIGAPGDEIAATETASRMRSDAAVLAGRTTVAELKGILGCSSLVVSNDTGAAHVSAALGVPTVVVFGPTEHVATRPLSDAAAVVRHDVYCSPCMLRDCPIDHRCMTGVTASDVYDAAQQVLSKGRGSVIV